MELPDPKEFARKTLVKNNISRVEHTLQPYPKLKCWLDETLTERCLVRRESSTPGRYAKSLIKIVDETNKHLGEHEQITESQMRYYNYRFFEDVKHKRYWHSNGAVYIGRPEVDGNERTAATSTGQRENSKPPGWDREHAAVGVPSETEANDTR